MSTSKAFVLGTFSNIGQQIWAPDAKVFSSVKESIEYLKPDGPILDDIAHELNLSRGELLEKLPTIDFDIAVDALTHVLQSDPKVAIRTFRSLHEAKSFIMLIGQMDEQRTKELKRQKRRLLV